MSNEDFTLETWIKGARKQPKLEGPHHKFRVDENGVIHRRSPVKIDEEGWYHIVIDVGHLCQSSTSVCRKIDLGNCTEYWKLCDECSNWYRAVTFFHGPKRL